MVLLPIFFALSGFNTNLRLVFGGKEALVLRVVTLAIVETAVGIWCAVRSCQVKPATTWNLAWLMSGRGLTELNMLNIGLRPKIISPTIFGLVVIMALVTTTLTGPLLRMQRDPAAQKTVAVPAGG